MTIYIESFLIQNIIINFCLIRLVFLTVKSKSSGFKQIVSSVVGAGFSVVVAIFLTNHAIINCLKLMCAMVMIIIAFKQTKKQFFANLIFLFLYTFAMFGFVSSISQANIVTSFGIITASKINLNLVCLFVILFTYIVEFVCKTAKNKVLINKYIFSAKLYLNNHKLKINAYLDSGNLLNIDNQPVVVLDLNSFLTLSKMNLAEYLLKPSKTISNSTISGNGQMKVFVIDKIEVSVGKKKRVILSPMVAINNSTFLNLDYKALLSPLMI